MKQTLIILTILAVVTVIGLTLTDFSSDAIIDAKEVETGYFANLGSEWTLEQFAVDIDQLEIVIAAAKFARLGYVPTTTAHNSVTGKMKVGYEAFGVLNTSFELFPPPCEPYPDCFEIIASK